MKDEVDILGSPSLIVLNMVTVEIKHLKKDANNVSLFGETLGAFSTKLSVNSKVSLNS